MNENEGLWMFLLLKWEKACLRKWGGMIAKME